MARIKQTPRRHSTYVSPTHIDHIVIPNDVFQMIVDEGMKKVEEDIVRAVQQCNKLGLEATEKNVIKMWRLQRRMTC